MTLLLRFVTAAFLVGLGTQAPCAAQQLYRWVDENGRVQYSDRPPPPGVQSQAKPIKKKPAGETQGSKTYAEQEAEFRKRQVEKAEKEAQEQQERQAAAARKRQCDEARSHLAGLQAGGQLVRYNAQGEREFLEDKAREEEIVRAQKAIASLCK